MSNQFSPASRPNRSSSRSVNSRASRHRWTPSAALAVGVGGVGDGASSVGFSTAITRGKSVVIFHNQSACDQVCGAPLGDDKFCFKDHGSQDRCIKETFQRRRHLCHRNGKQTQEGSLAQAKRSSWVVGST